MKLTVQVKLLPDAAQCTALKETLKVSNAACNRLSELAWTAKEFRRFPMHRLFYRQMRQEFALSSQIVCLLNAKVADAYKLDRCRPRRFKTLGSITYDNRVLFFDIQKSEVSIWTVQGRQRMSFECNDRQRALVSLKRGETDLVHRNGKWFLNVSVTVADRQEQEARGWLGIDLGLTNIATTSDGGTFGDANKVAGIRSRRFRQRKRLQTKRTRSAKRVLRGLSGREKRFSRQVNHEISKQIVAEAERTGRGIALEDLTHIRERIRARKEQRRRLYSWAFADLQSKISYKAKLIGIPVKFIDPRNTSRTCQKCGHVDKENRKTQAHFECVSCGYTANADANAAENIRRAAIDQPYEQKGVRVHAQ